MPAVATVTSIDATLNHFIVKGTIAVSGSYPGTPGDTLSFKVPGMPATTQPPDWVEIWEMPPAGTPASGLVYDFAKGATQANGQLQVYVGGAAVSTKMAQLANVTYASVGAANIVFKAEFPKFQ